MIQLYFAFIQALLCLSLVSTARSAVFGSDGIEDVLEAPRHLELAQSVAVSVLKSNYEMDESGNLKLDVDTLKKALCEDERFASEFSFSYSCTGFLVGPDLLVTAGHCSVNVGEVKNEKEGYCEVFSWLFDFQMESSGTVLTSGISPSRHYRCKQIIYAAHDEVAPHRDFALIQLDRPVTDRQPLKIAPALKLGQKFTGVSLWEPVFMMGFPLGMPMKFSGGARVIHNDLARSAFVTNLDAMAGNSGSPVFNNRSEVVGILVGGTPSQNFYKDSEKGCYRVNRCDDFGRNCVLPDKDNSIFPSFQVVGSEVQRIQEISDLISKLGLR